MEEFEVILRAEEACNSTEIRFRKGYTKERYDYYINEFKLNSKIKKLVKITEDGEEVLIEKDNKI